MTAGVIVGGAVPPLACLLTWKRCTSAAAISGTVIEIVIALSTHISNMVMFPCTRVPFRPYLPKIQQCTADNVELPAGSLRCLECSKHESSQKCPISRQYTMSGVEGKVSWVVD